MTDLLGGGTAVSMLAVFLGACVQGFAGIGFALFAAPLIVLVRPELVPGPMLVLGGAISLLAALRERGKIDYRSAGIAFAGRVPGSVLAGLVVGLLPKSTFSLIFGVLILAAVALSLAARRVEPHPRYLGLAGFVSGFMGTITAVGTPPMGLVMQSAEPARLRATIGIFLVAGSIVSIAVLGLAGRFHWRDVTLSLLLLPPLALGFAVSSVLMGRFQPRLVRYAVLGISAASSLLLVAKSL
jgi:hypothetical protein